MNHVKTFPELGLKEQFQLVKGFIEKIINVMEVRNAAGKRSSVCVVRKTDPDSAQVWISKCRSSALQVYECRRHSHRGPRHAWETWG